MKFLSGTILKLHYHNQIFYSFVFTDNKIITGIFPRLKTPIFTPAANNLIIHSLGLLIGYPLSLSYRQHSDSFLSIESFRFVSWPHNKITLTRERLLAGLHHFIWTITKAQSVT